MTAAAAGASLELRGAGRRFGPITALAETTLTIAPGESVLVLGANGAGKSTMLRLAAGLLRPTSGAVLVGGVDQRGNRAAAARAAVGFLGHRSFLFDHLTARENLVFYARLYGAGGDAGALAREWLARVGLERAAERVVRGFSRGMTQRLTLARALIHGPRLLLLDEPTTGLDPDGRARLDAVIAAQRDAGMTMLTVSHRAAAALPLCSRVVVLQRGRVLADGRADERDADTWAALALPAARPAGA